MVTNETSFGQQRRRVDMSPSQTWLSSPSLTGGKPWAPSTPGPVQGPAGPYHWGSARASRSLGLLS